MTMAGTDIDGIWLAILFSLAALSLHDLVANVAMGEEMTKVVVSQALLDTSNKTERYSVPSRISCAAAANERNWSSLVCYKDMNCYIYSLELGINHNDTAFRDAIPCYTKLKISFDITECHWNNRRLMEYDTVVVLPQCVKYECYQRTMVPFYEALEVNCSEGFQDIPGLGCIQHFDDTQLDFQAATNHCLSLGAALMVPFDIVALQVHMNCRESNRFGSGDYWIGEGEGSAEGEGSGEGSGTYCQYVSSSSSYLAVEGNCSSSLKFTCQELA